MLRIIGLVYAPHTHHTHTHLHHLPKHPCLAAETPTNPSAEEREAQGITDGLVRVAVGVEDTDDLVADFAQALEAV